MIDGDAVRQLMDAGAEAASLTTVLVPGEPGMEGVIALRTPDGYKVETIDLAQYMPTRRRPQGTVTVRNAHSFITYVGELKTDETSVFAESDRVVAVFNHEGGLGWGDHRCVYELKFTPAWTTPRTTPASSASPRYPSTPLG